MFRISRLFCPALILLALVAAACQPQVVTQTVEVVVTKEVPVEVTRQVPVEATAPAPPASEGETIRIGGIGPLSAPGDVVGGIAMQFTMNLAVKDINEKGGVLGKPLELIFADTEGLPERGTAVAERLINEDKVVAITGEYHSAVGLAVLEVAHKYGLPVLFSETWSDKITETGYPEVFRIAPASTMNSRASAEWLKAVGAENVVIIAENTDYGTGQVESDKKFFDELGIQVLDAIFVELNTQDFQPILARIQAMDPPPDAIRVNVTGQASYNLEQQMVDLGIAPSEKTIGSASSDAIAPEFWESVPNGNHYTFSYIGLPPSLFNDITKHVAEEYEKVFKTQPPSYALEAYDSVWIVADAIQRAGTSESQALIAALEDTDITLAQGRYYFKYTSKNPLPGDGSVPAYMWHQWPDPAILVMQYFEANQSWQDAAVIWPPAYQTHGTSYIPYGTTP
ncbi:MAG: ABC transporter substrate-binding protein [Anaerolineales bacterium]|nr:ABC transporter substrate-binding protein [Anaerolineales bacterium]